MDARTRKQHQVEEEHEADALAEAITAKRDRLLASLTLIAGIGVIVAMPFALRAGAEFFMPVTAALVVAIALVPCSNGSNGAASRRRRRPGFASCIFLTIAIFAIGSIVDPGDATGSRRCRPRSPRYAPTLEPVIRSYKNLDRFIGRTFSNCDQPGEPRADGAIEHARIRCSACCHALRRIF